MSTDSEPVSKGSVRIVIEVVILLMALAVFIASAMIYTNAQLAKAKAELIRETTEVMIDNGQDTTATCLDPTVKEDNSDNSPCASYFNSDGKFDYTVVVRNDSVTVYTRADNPHGAFTMFKLRSQIESLDQSYEHKTLDLVPDRYAKGSVIAKTYRSW